MSLNVWQDSPGKPSGPGAFFIKRVLTMNSIFKTKNYSCYLSLLE